MRFDAKGPLLLLLFVTSTRVALAQERRTTANGTFLTSKTPGPQQKLAAPRLLTPNEALAILGAALDSRHHPADFSSDCSHFVHRLYESAGFPYQYASSSDLYEGTDDFRRVESPQTGDLTVWRGHSGIVVNPDQHSFFSVLRSGPGVDSFDSTYWKQRGRPRFFRYLKPAPGGAAHSSIRTASWQPTILKDAKQDEPARDQVRDISESFSESSKEVASPAKLIETNSANSPAVVLNSRPLNSEQMTAAFLQACNRSQEMLRGHDLIRSAQSFVVFDHFEVKKVHTSGNKGWIEVQFDGLVSLTGGKAEIHKQSEQQQWALRREDKNRWKLIPSRSAIYLPQHTAERILAHDLAQLTEDAPDNASGTQENAELVRLLDVLFGR